jgi:hypothetical protein
MKIQLPDFVLVDLYKNSLVIADEITKPKPSSEAESASALFLGNNNKYIAILIKDSQNRYIGDDSLQLLVNMLSALQLSLQDVAVINISVTPFTYKEIGEQFGARVCLMFGVSTQSIELPFQMPDYKVQAFSDCKFLCSASLDKMKGNSKEAKVEKTKLWMCLKSIFE